jgi:hypothetical protein
MSPNEHIQVPYNLELHQLEHLLKKVRRPGDYFTSGALEIPMPRIEVKTTGVLSFPIPEAQALQIVDQAERAPYGRGKETLLDTSVRKVWQLSPTEFTISGKSWENTLSSILAQVKRGLGCENLEISAELYKMLVYDPGSFFLSHRGRSP